jgi:hypothetical protein
MNKPRGKTGPTTEQGKRISSQNASKHNCTSMCLIVKGEDPAAFAALLESLIAEYQPETEGQHITVHEAARAAWELARANREFDKSQHKLYKQQPNMREWNAEQQAEFERMLRYRTRAERSYGRGLKAVEYLRKLHLQAQQRAFWENLQTERLALSKQRLQLSISRLKKATKPNQRPKEKAAAAQPSSGFVHFTHSLTEDQREQTDLSTAAAQAVHRFEFPDGVPAAHALVNAPDIQHKQVAWEQRFETLYALRANVNRVAASAPGHFSPPD